MQRPKINSEIKQQLKNGEMKYPEAYEKIMEDWTNEMKENFELRPHKTHGIYVKVRSVRAAHRDVGDDNHEANDTHREAGERNKLIVNLTKQINIILDKMSKLDLNDEEISAIKSNL